MITSQKGIKLIQEFESCKLIAYKPKGEKVTPYYTIGWGHYGKDVRKNQKITFQEADRLLVNDLKKCEKAVQSIPQYPQLNQNQFDALVSFTYNCGVGCLNQLVKGRDLKTISQKILLYNKSGGKVLKGLTRRRAREQELFLSK